MPHPYTYYFYESVDRQIATIETDQPIAHLLAGNQLLVEIDGYEPKRGYHLEIQFVRVRLVRKNKAAPLHHEIHVICEERERTSPL